MLTSQMDVVSIWKRLLALEYSSEYKAASELFSQGSIVREVFLIERGLAGWATFQVMRRAFATLSKAVGVDAHTRSAQMGNIVDVNENEYAVTSFAEKLAAVRLLETAVVSGRREEPSQSEASRTETTRGDSLIGQTLPASAISRGSLTQ